MSYQAIYRKWRPMTFEDVVGQKHITDTLKNEIKHQKVAHAYLFCGTRGTGKTSTAKILSRAINCDSPAADANPCNACPSCRGIISGSIMDVMEIDAASNTGVDNIRALRDEVAYTPAHVKYKVYIIDEVHMLSTGAFNALLKTLEEPPAHVIFILATTEPHKIPATIQSRCQRFDFRRISAADIAGRIWEIVRADGISITKEAVELVASLGDGSMRDALSILDLCSGVSGEITREDIESLAGVSGRGDLRRICAAVFLSDAAEAVSLAHRSVGMGRDVTGLAQELLGMFRELLICKISKDPSLLSDYSGEEAAALGELSAQATEEGLLHGVRALSDAVSVCKWADYPKVILESALIKLCRPETDATHEAFAARLKKLEAAVLLGAGVEAAMHPAAKPAQGLLDNNPPDEKQPDEKPADVIKAEEPDELPPWEAKPQEEGALADRPLDEKQPEQAWEPFTASEEAEEETDLSPPPAQEQETPATAVEPAASAHESAPKMHESVPNAEESESEAESPSGGENPGWAQAVAAIKAREPAAGGLLEHTKNILSDDVFYVVFETAVMRDFVSDNAPLVALIKKYAGERLLRLVTAAEFGRKKAARQETDPLDELLAKGDALAGQITII